MSSKASHRDNPEITATTFPALRSFMRGYFHEDMATNMARWMKPCASSAKMRTRRSAKQ